MAEHDLAQAIQCFMTTAECQAVGDTADARDVAPGTPPGAQPPKPRRQSTEERDFELAIAASLRESEATAGGSSATGNDVAESSGGASKPPAPDPRPSVVLAIGGKTVFMSHAVCKLSDMIKGSGLLESGEDFNEPFRWQLRDVPPHATRDGLARAIHLAERLAKCYASTTELDAEHDPDRLSAVFCAASYLGFGEIVRATGKRFGRLLSGKSTEQMLGSFHFKPRLSHDYARASLTEDLFTPPHAPFAPPHAALPTSEPAAGLTSQPAAGLTPPPARAPPPRPDKVELANKWMAEQQSAAEAMDAAGGASSSMGVYQPAAASGTAASPPAAAGTSTDPPHAASPSELPCPPPPTPPRVPKRTLSESTAGGDVDATAQILRDHCDLPTLHALKGTTDAWRTRAREALCGWKGKLSRLSASELRQRVQVHSSPSSNLSYPVTELSHHVQVGLPSVGTDGGVAEGAVAEGGPTPIEPTVAAGVARLLCELMSKRQGGDGVDVRVACVELLRIHCVGAECMWLVDVVRACFADPNDRVRRAAITCLAGYEGSARIRVGQQLFDPSRPDDMPTILSMVEELEGRPSSRPFDLAKVQLPLTMGGTETLFFPQLAPVGADWEVRLLDGQRKTGEVERHTDALPLTLATYRAVLLEAAKHGEVAMLRQLWPTMRRSAEEHTRRAGDERLAALAQQLENGPLERGPLQHLCPTWPGGSWAAAAAADAYGLRVGMRFRLRCGDETPWVLQSVVCKAGGEVHIKFEDRGPFEGEAPPRMSGELLCFKRAPPSHFAKVVERFMGHYEFVRDPDPTDS